MSKNKNHIDENTFSRYLANQMTDTERNAFEKNLQKNPFEAEALEGFEAASLSNLSNDLSDIRKNIQPTKKNNRTFYWAAAASVLLLITAGIIWMQVNQESPIPKMTEHKISLQTEEVTTKTKEESSILETNNTDTNIELPASGVQSKMAVAKRHTEAVPVSTNVEKKESSEEIEDEELYVDDKLAKQFVAATAQARSLAEKQTNTAENQDSALGSVKMTKQVLGISAKKTISAKVISAEDSMPIAEKSISNKVVSNGIAAKSAGQLGLKVENDSNTKRTNFEGMETAAFKIDTDTLPTLSAHTEALNTVVPDDYASQKKQATNKATSAKASSDPLPVGGMPAYEKYLEKNAQLPNDYPKNKAIVKVVLHINEAGEITLLENTNEVDSEIFGLTRKLIAEGAAWQPGYKNDKGVKSHVKLRIVFRKD